MKKNSISRFTVIIVTALFMLTATNSFASKNVQPSKVSVKQPIKGESFTAYVTINLSGMADTPYWVFSTQPELVYSEVSSLLARQSGTFHVLVTIKNKDGEIVEEYDYYVNNQEPYDAIKYD